MSKPTLIVLARSEPWCSAISRNFPDCELSWVLNVPTLVDESFKFHAPAAIVELPAAGVDEFCIELSELCNNSVQLKLFAVGDRDRLKWQPLLQAAGVAAWHWSLLQIPSLVQAIAKHHSSVRIVNQSTESRVWADLPWPTAASDRHA